MTEALPEWSVARVARVRPYRWFSLAYFLDELCNAVWLVTLGWLIAGTSSDLASAGILLATGVPLAVVLVLFSGWVDRHSSRRVALITLAARAAVMLVWVAVVAADAAPYALVAVVGAVIGVISGVHEPAMTTYPIAILPASGQAAAVVVERGSQRLSQAVGGIVAGFLLAHGGISAPAAAGAVAIIVALGIMTRLNRSLPIAASTDEGDADAEEATTRIRGGWDFVRQHPLLPRTLAVQTAITTAMGVVLMVTLPFRARQEHWSAAAFGGIFTAFGIGMSIATAIGFVLQSRPERSRLVMAGAMALASGVCIVVVGAATNAVVTLIAMAALGLCLGPAGPFLSGYLRSVTAQADAAGGVPVSGRVMAVLILATDAMEPVGFLIGVGLAAVFPLAVPTVLFGALCVVVSGWTLLSVLRRPLPGPVGHQSAV